MFERILVCLDGSKLSGQILPYAEEQALRFSSKVVLLQVVTLPTIGVAGTEASPATGAMIAEQLQLKKKEAMNYLESVARSLQAKKIQVEVIILEATPVGNAIVDYASNNKIDLIAIATHGRSGLGRAVLGSVADFVLRESGLPILVIRPREA